MVTTAVEQSGEQTDGLDHAVIVEEEVGGAPSRGRIDAILCGDRRNEAGEDDG